MMVIVMPTNINSLFLVMTQTDNYARCYSGYTHAHMYPYVVINYTYVIREVYVGAWYSESWIKVKKRSEFFWDFSQIYKNDTEMNHFLFPRMDSACVQMQNGSL